MKKCIFLIVITAIVAASWAFYNLQVTKTSRSSGSSIPYSARLSSDALYEGIRKDIWYVYDTRKYIEYIYSHLPTARSLPLNMLEKRLSEVPKDKEIVLIFENGTDAEQGWNIFITNGYNQNDIKVFDENIEEWSKKGYPIEDHIPAGC
ncbi:hypothetical protein ADMFC3_00810 [Geovibrio sp. ADMFC3]